MPKIFILYKTHISYETESPEFVLVTLDKEKAQSKMDTLLKSSKYTKSFGNINMNDDKEEEKFFGANYTLDLIGVELQ